MAQLLGLLREYVGAGETADDSFLSSCLEEARQLVGGYVGANKVPTPVKDRAVLDVAAELFHRRQAPGGIAQFATFDGQSPVRLARDPMQAAYPILRPYLGGGFA